MPDTVIILNSPGISEDFKREVKRRLLLRYHAKCPEKGRADMYTIYFPYTVSYHS